MFLGSCSRSFILVSWVFHVSWVFRVSWVFHVSRVFHSCLFCLVFIFLGSVSLVFHVSFTLGLAFMFLGTPSLMFLESLIHFS